MTEFNIALRRIKEKVLLSAVVVRDVQLRKKGKEFIGNCPFHNEKTGSFFVNDEKGSFYCFGCGATGDLFSYVMKKDCLSFNQAVEKLAEMAGIKLPEKHRISHETERNQLILQKAIEFFQNNLRTNKVAKEYCVKRNITNEVIDKFSIGYAPNNNELLTYIRNCGFSNNELTASGLFVKNDFGTYQRFKNRIMFPVFDRNNQPIAFGGRAMQKDATPKYLNSSESEVFQKKETLYAYNIAYKNVNQNEPFIIAEGYIDVIILHKHGFNTAIASMGTAFSEEHLEKIWRCCDKPIVCFDGDSSGYAAMVRVASLAMSHISPEKSLKFAIIPDNEDPDSFLTKFGKQKFQEILKNSLHLVDFLWHNNKIEYAGIAEKTPENIAKWKASLFEQISGIKDLELKKLYKSDLSNRVFELLNWRRFKKKEESPANNFSVNSLKKKTLREAILVYTLIKRPSIVPFVAERAAMLDFSDKNFQKLMDIILCFSECDTNSKLENIESYVIDEATQYCCFDEMNDEEILAFWNSVFDLGFVKKAHKIDLLEAKAECEDELSLKKWERLKELKIDSIVSKSIDES
ncbi:DNA primase [Alphaproteobacteria bacterium]|nr:DNA primase [Alphaproteobacteria bacterium]